MNIQELILSALTSLKNNGMRTFLTMLGIIIGISSVILIYAIGQGAVKYVNNELSSFGVNFFQVNPGTDIMSNFAGQSATLTKEDVDAIRKEASISNIQSVGAFATTSTTVAANDIEKNMMVYGMSPEVGDMLKPIMNYGTFITNENNVESERVIVMGKKAMESFFGPGINPVGEKVKIDNKFFKIIGVVSSGSALFGSFFDNAMFTPLNTALHQISGASRIREIDINVINSDLMNETIEQVSNLLRERHNLKEGEANDFMVASMTDTLNITERITSVLTIIIVAISAISLVVGGVGVMNIMLVSVTERTREIGLLKAIGAQEKDILYQFIIEAMVMTGIGGLMGILFGILCAFLVSILFGLPLVISPIAILIAFSVSMLVGIGFGLYPARKAARLAPIDALRYE